MAFASLGVYLWIPLVVIKNQKMEDFSGKESAFDFGVNSPKTTNSVQKCSKIRNFCTEFPYFASIAKIESVCIAKSHIFVFFLQKLAF